MDASDGDLLSSMRHQGVAASTAAFAQLYARHVDAARAAAYRIAPRFDRDDIVSESFTRILSAIENGAGPRVAFRPYLYQTVRNVAADLATAPRARLESSLELLQNYEPAPVADIADDVSTYDEVLRAVSTMPERWQTVLWHTEVEGYAPQEIADSLGLSANYVAQIRHRARKRLRCLVSRP